ncbi:FecR family protein [Chitinophaga silvatica]|uniref:FecR family protein n=1 Tax=Chitinophaga silvatica TaxID=2282649 RepID=A0A3E1YFR6_9BACT|nr:FecR family protein [Chitinophaga silvatica]RFS26212.1 FecR family protein [Chitinophaga silvatica]
MMHDRIWYLLGRKVANELLPEEAEELEHLLQQYPDASYVKEILMQSWKDKQKEFTSGDIEAALLRNKQRLLEVQSQMPTEPIPAKRNSKVFRLSLRVASVAAAAVLLFLVSRIWLGRGENDKREQPALQQLVTKTGSRTYIKLTDGTSVWLNAGSKLHYPKQFEGKNREVTLEGEAYFEVATDANHPFIVKTNACSIRVLGTSFNVRFYPDEKMATTSLVTGSIEVVADRRTVRLQPNEKLTIPYSLPATNTANVETPPIKLSTLTPVKDNIVVETAWKDNKLAFKKLALSEVVQLMERWYGAEIHFKSEQKKSLVFSGVFENESLTEALQALEMSGGFHFTKDKNNIYWIE